MKIRLGPLFLAIASIGTLALCEDAKIISRGNESKNSFTPRDKSEATTTAVTVPKPSASHRPKRNIGNLYYMLKCNPGCNPMHYLGYGCYCGPGTLYLGLAMDGIDKCCQMHDDCYEQTSCRVLANYWWSYPWTCLYGSIPICAKEQGFFAWLLGIRDCPQQLCNCDRDLAYCLSQYPCPSYKMKCEAQWSIYNNYGVDDDYYERYEIYR